MNDYENVEVVLIGTAAENVLGIFSVGSDSDGTAYPEPLDFMEDSNSSL